MGADLVQLFATVMWMGLWAALGFALVFTAAFITEVIAELVFHSSVLAPNKERPSRKGQGA